MEKHKLTTSYIININRIEQKIKLTDGVIVVELEGLPIKALLPLKVNQQCSRIKFLLTDQGYNTKLYLKDGQKIKGFETENEIKFILPYLLLYDLVCHDGYMTFIIKDYDEAIDMIHGTYLKTSIFKPIIAFRYGYLLDRC